MLLTEQSERKVQSVVDNDLSALFGEAIERRARGERVIIGSGEVTP